MAFFTIKNFFPFNCKLDQQKRTKFLKIKASTPLIKTTEDIRCDTTVILVLSPKNKEDCGMEQELRKTCSEQSKGYGLRWFLLNKGFDSIFQLLFGLWSLCVTLQPQIHSLPFPAFGGALGSWFPWTTAPWLLSSGFLFGLSIGNGDISPFPFPYCSSVSLMTTMQGNTTLSLLGSCDTGFWLLSLPRSPTTSLPTPLKIVPTLKALHNASWVCLLFLPKILMNSRKYNNNN